MSRIHVRFRLAIGAMLAVLVCAAGAAPATAQDGNQCPLQPISLPLFEATPAAVIVQTPTASADAPEPTEEELTAAAEGLIACTNESSQAVRYAVFTDQLLALQFTKDDPAYQPSFERMIATGELSEPGSNVLQGVSDIEPLDEGRVAVTLHISTPDGELEDRVVLAWDADREAWLIDGIVSLGEAGTPAG